VQSARERWKVSKLDEAGGHYATVRRRHTPTAEQIETADVAKLKTTNLHCPSFLFGPHFGTRYERHPVVVGRR
jgi:hypothetical protein